MTNQRNAFFGKIKYSRESFGEVFSFSRSHLRAWAGETRARSCEPLNENPPRATGAEVECHALKYIHQERPAGADPGRRGLAVPVDARRPVGLLPGQPDAGADRRPGTDRGADFPQTGERPFHDQPGE